MFIAVRSSGPPELSLLSSQKPVREGIFNHSKPWYPDVPSLTVGLLTPTIPAGE